MKIIEVAGVGEVQLRKSKRAKRLILKINHTGKPQVTFPNYIPYIIAEQHAKKHASWFLQHLPKNSSVLLYDQKRIGKQHILQIIPNDNTSVRSRVNDKSITIYVPRNFSIESKQVQEEAAKAAKRALRRQAEALLPALLYNTAIQNNLSYSEVRIKTMRTRWGSCSSNKIINLSIWLMQLPDELIRYVICHELAHLSFMNHSKQFWQTVEVMDANYAAHRMALKNYRPSLM